MNKPELKPFHESIVDEVDECLKKFYTYSRSTRDFVSQPTFLLIKDLNVIVRLINSTEIPEDKILNTQNALKQAFDKIIATVGRLGHEKDDILEIKKLFVEIAGSLNSRLN